MSRPSCCYNVGPFRVQTSKKTVQKAAAGPTVQISDGVSEFYANSMNVLITPWDFVLLFGSTLLPKTIRQGAQTAGDVRVDAAIRMSPQHAKAASRVLAKLIEEYEKQVGVITLPKEPAK